jgi:hypothetical protein
MAKAIEGIDWKAIEEGWCNGVTAEQLSALHGATVTNIRTRAFRKQWQAKNPSVTKTIVAKAAKRAVNKAVAKATARIEKRAEATVEACIEESIRLGQSFMQRAKRSIEEVEDGNLSGVATLGRTGVDLWRKSLGLDATSSNGATCGISFSFVMRQDGMPTITPLRPLHDESATIDVESV